MPSHHLPAPKAQEPVTSALSIAITPAVREVAGNYIMKSAWRPQSIYLVSGLMQSHQDGYSPISVLLPSPFTPGVRVRALPARQSTPQT